MGLTDTGKKGMGHRKRWQKMRLLKTKRMELVDPISNPSPSHSTSSTDIQLLILALHGENYTNVEVACKRISWDLRWEAVFRRAT